MADEREKRRDDLRRIIEGLDHTRGYQPKDEVEEPHRAPAVPPGSASPSLKSNGE